MSASVLAAPDSSLNVRYNRRVQDNRGAGEENQVEISGDEEHHADSGSQNCRPQTPKHRVKRRCFTAVTLGVMHLLILAGVFIRYISITLEKDQLQARYDKLYNNYSELQGQISDMAVNNRQLKSSYQTLSNNNSQLQDEVKQLKSKIDGKWCPEGWKRYGCSCYCKFNGEKTWSGSRSDCQRKGADLVIVNSQEEQKFVTDLNKNGDSWIGLKATEKRTPTGWTRQWEWVDSSPLTETFWAEGLPQQHWDQPAACCNQYGQWTQSIYYNQKNWICEK